MCPGLRPWPGVRSRFDWTRLRNLDFENSLTAYSTMPLSAKVLYDMLANSMPAFIPVLQILLRTDRLLGVLRRSYLSRSPV